MWGFFCYKIVSKEISGNRMKYVVKIPTIQGEI